MAGARKGMPCYTSVFSEGLQVDQDVIEVDAYEAFHDEVSEDGDSSWSGR